MADLDHARAAASRFRALAPGAPLTVVGGGLTGVETAAELAAARSDVGVWLVTRGALGSWLSPCGRRALADGLRRPRVEVAEHTTMTADDADGMVVWATGFTVSPFAARAGLATTADGRIRVDDRLRSVSHPGVYAAGDTAAATVAGHVAARMCCQTGIPTGQQVGSIVADDLRGRPPRRCRLRFVWATVSLGRRDGVVQFSGADDRPLPWTLCGRRAAAMKEGVTRSALFVLR